MTKPTYEFEKAALQGGAFFVAGVDEVGRGPLSGPVTAAAVILDPKNIPDGLNDSKKMSVKKRDQLFDIILSSATCCIAHASVDEIDEINILRASHLAMERAVAGLSTQADFALIDGNMIPKRLTIPAQSIVKGDGKCLSIAAASIIAKVERDRLMTELSVQFPGYGWEKNAGYGTKQHFEALTALGVTPHHRRSFKPIHNILYQEK